MAREYKKTEKRLRDEFKRDIAPHIPKRDKPALRGAFNDWIDSLHREGKLTDYQAFNITYPPEYN